MSVKNTSKPTYLTNDFHIFYYLPISSLILHLTTEIKANCIRVMMHGFEFILYDKEILVDLRRAAERKKVFGCVFLRKTTIKN